MVGDKYIKMCKEAEELQKDWEPKVGDRTLYHHENLSFLTDRRFDCSISKEMNFRDIKAVYSWLPYQEQLQELIPEDKWGWAMELLEGYCSDPDEMEYGWLEIYMQIVHNEEWNCVMDTWDELEDD